MQDVTVLLTLESTSHPPQFHRIGTWISWISPTPKYSLRLALCFVTSHPFRDDLLPIPWTPVHTSFRYRSNVHSPDTSYRTFDFRSRCFIKIQLERFRLTPSLSYLPDNRPCKGPLFQSYSLLPYLNLGTRFLVVEEICNIPSLSPQWSPSDHAKSSSLCHKKIIQVQIQNSKCKSNI